MEKIFGRNLIDLIIIIASIAFAGPAAAFTFQDDPSSTWSGDALTTRSINGNVVTYENLFAQNLTAISLPSLNFAIPFIWPDADSTFIPMQWRNDLNGWYTNDFNDTGTSLTVKLTAPITSPVLMSEIADLTGVQQLPLTEPCESKSPSCIPASYLPETRNSTDGIPVFALGEFGPNETKRFDLSFTYSFGDQQGGALPTAFIAHTISPVAVIPEPETYALFLAGIGLLSLIAHRNKTL